MRIVQNILLIVGAVALGIVVCGLGLGILATITLFRPRPGSEPGLNWGAAFGFVGCGGCGSVFGIITGVMLAIRHIRDHGHELWRPFTWGGIGIGLTVALGIRVSGVFERFGIINDLIGWWVGSLVFIAAAGAAGGLAGGLLGGPRSSKKKSDKPRVKRIF